MLSLWFRYDPFDTKFDPLLNEFIELLTPLIVPRTTLPFSVTNTYRGGINGTSFYAYAELKNGTAFNFTGSFTYQGFSVKSISPNEIEITYEFGSLSQLYSKLDSMR